MRIRRLLFLLAFTGLLSFSARAQLPELINKKEFRPEAKAAVDSIYNFNFEGADAQLSEWMEKYPDHPLWSLMDGMKYWWKVLSDLEDTSHDERFTEIMQRVNYQAGKLLHSQPMHADGLIIKAISNGYLARHHANRSQWLTSINYGRDAMQAHSYLMEKQPELADLKLAEGLKLYYTAYLPEAYPIVKTVSWALPEGDKQKGLRLIREAAEEAIFARAEASYFIGNINYNYEKNYEIALDAFNDLYKQYPNNGYYARLVVKSSYNLGRYEEVLTTVDTTMNRWRENNLPFGDVLAEELLTWKGRALEKGGAYRKAEASYRKAYEAGKNLPNPGRRGFHHAAGYHLGSLLVQKFDNCSEGGRYLRQVTKMDAEASYKNRSREMLERCGG